MKGVGLWSPSRRGCVLSLSSRFAAAAELKGLIVQPTKKITRFCWRKSAAADVTRLAALSVRLFCSLIRRARAIYCAVLYNKNPRPSRCYKVILRFIAQNVMWCTFLSVWHSNGAMKVSGHFPFLSGEKFRVALLPQRRKTRRVSGEIPRILLFRRVMCTWNIRRSA